MAATSPEPGPETWQALEEKFTFLERDMEHVRDQIGELWKRLVTLERRLDQALARLESAQDGE